MREGTSGAQLETVIVFTEQMEELAAWYQQALGLPSFEASPGHLGQRLGATYLGFDQLDSDLADGKPGVTLWFTVDDVEAVFDRLLAMGAKVRYPPNHKPWGAWLASVYGPDGNIIGIAQRRPASAVTQQ